MKEIVFFSNNKNKILEVKNLLKYTSTNILTLNDFTKIKSPKENGLSFEDNAKIKAIFGLNYFNKPCFADDSGICIEALNEKPGIKSKNFIEENGGLKNTFKIIFSAIKKTKKVNAYFQTSICLSINLNKNIFFKGILKGSISMKEKGSGGFGYDPIFIPNDNNQTLAEMTIREKNSISHRSIAIKNLKNYLQNLV